MNHPMIIKTSEHTNSIKITDARMQKLIEKPRPIMWNRAGMYHWVPIEKIMNMIRWYQDKIKLGGCFTTITLGDTVVIPKEAGDAIMEYNGHED